MLSRLVFTGGQKKINYTCDLDNIRTISESLQRKIKYLGRHSSLE